MAQTVQFRLDDAAVGRAEPRCAVRLRGCGIPTPTDRPAVTAAAAAAVAAAPPAPRCDAELATLALPSIWLATLGTVAGRPDELVLAAVVDAELLAVHAAVHDALAGRVRARSRRTCPAPGCRTACWPPSGRPRRSRRCTRSARCAPAWWRSTKDGARTGTAVGPQRLPSGRGSSSEPGPLAHAPAGSTLASWPS